MSLYCWEIEREREGLVESKVLTEKFYAKKLKEKIIIIYYYYYYYYYQFSYINAL